MNFEEVVKYRRSVRQYNDTPLDSEKVKHCLELASLAPQQFQYATLGVLSHY
jgi:nitroreductase